MLIGARDKYRDQAPEPEPGMYSAVIQDAVYYELAARDGRDLPGCVRLSLYMTGAGGEQVQYTDRIYLRESTLWRLHQLHHALGLTEPMEIEKFISILPGLHVGVQITRSGPYTRVRFMPAKAVSIRIESAEAAPDEPDEPLPF